jgi:hypothetical protein
LKYRHLFHCEDTYSIYHYLLGVQSIDTDTVKSIGFQSISRELDSILQRLNSKESLVETTLLSNENVNARLLYFLEQLIIKKTKGWTWLKTLDSNGLKTVFSFFILRFWKIIVQSIHL